MSDTLCSLMLPAHGAAGERGGGAGGSSGCGALGADSDAALEALRWEEAQRQARYLTLTLTLTLTCAGRRRSARRVPWLSPRATTPRDHP